MTQLPVDVGPEARVIVLHPNDVLYQHRNMWHFVPEHRSVYIRFDGSKLSAPDLRQQFDEALKLQQVESSSNLEYILIDEYDRAEQEALATFIKYLLDEMPETRLILAGRRVPTRIVQDNGLASDVRFYPTDDNRMLHDYREMKSDEHLLEVRAFGSGHVLLDGKPIENWDGVLPRTLFFFLIDRGMVTRDVIFETFWPHMNVREATNVFHVTKRKISEVLGMDLTVYSAGFYRISPNITLSYDVIRYTGLVQESVVASSREKEIAYLEQAVDLYRGPYLNGTNSDWISGRREELSQLSGDALAMLAEAKRAMGETDRALGLFMQASTTNVTREDIVSHIMRIYIEKGMGCDALTVYERLENALEERLKVRPATELQSLAAEARKLCQS